VLTIDQIVQVATHMVRVGPASNLSLFTELCILAHWVMEVSVPCDCACNHVLPSIGVLQNESRNFLILLVW